MHSLKSEQQLPRPLGAAEALTERAFLLEDTMHILICDDDAVFAARVETLVRDFFARRGLQVECTVCHSGEETLARRDLDLYLPRRAGS